MNSFYWLAGADSAALERCSVSEKIKIGGIGSLVLVPPFLGCISMSHAISIVIEGNLLPYFFGFLWGAAILGIDRQLVAISYNVKNKSTEIVDTWQSNAKLVGKFFMRLVFAIGIGITVSHPLVLLIFNSSIIEYLQKQKQGEIQTVQNTELAKISTLNEQIRAKEETKRCYEKLLTLEQSGGKPEVTPCGNSSGKRGCANNCEKIQGFINDLNKEIADLRSSIAPQIAKIENSGKIDRESLEENFSMDYLKRANTLSTIGEKEPHIAWVTRFLIIFFIFVDIMPIVMKMMTNTEEYENEASMNRIKTSLMYEATVEAYNAVIKQNTQEIQEQLQKYEDTKKSVNNIMQVSCDLLEITGNKYEEFEKKRESYKAKIKDLDKEEKVVATKYLIDIKNIFVAGIDLALQKARTVIFGGK